MTIQERVARHRQQLRERGLRPVQIWVPDVRSQKFAAEALRQSRVVGEAALGADEMSFIEAISDVAGE